MARTWKYTNKQIIQALEKTKGMVYLAAKTLGCHPDTIYKRAAAFSSVQSAIDAARGEVIDTAELALYDAILNREHWAITFALRTLGKNRGYIEKQQQEIIGEGGGPVDIRVVYEEDGIDSPIKKAASAAD